MSTIKGGTPSQPPEGRLIEKRRRQLGLSQNECAGRVGLAGNRWRAVVTGHKVGRNGGVQLVNARPSTWAKLAIAVDLDPRAFVAIGRPDIAQEMREYTEHPETSSVARGQRVLLVSRLEIIRDAFGVQLFYSVVREMIKRDGVTGVDT